MGYIVFHEGNNGREEVVHSVDDQPGQDFRPKTNDEARSVTLLNVRPGCVVSVFDDSRANRRDDFCVVWVKKAAAEYTVGTFERSYEDEYVLVSYSRKNGLDGKVSRIRID